ncbi:MAG TPA: DUF488 domain-containing protein [Phycisphaerales bacterium]|nr:DUF488 domain-containing protein [Phycisphaerales bacterium]
MIQLKRAYEKPSRSDGTRILVERLWPRGLKKEDAHLDMWVKELSPSPALRKWYAHDPAKWSEFKKRYIKELRANGESVAGLRAFTKRKPVTFVYAAKDEVRNSASVLKGFIENRWS